MTVKIVTDSSSEISPQLAQELGITVVPLYVRFGEEVFRERIDLSDDEFDHRLVHDRTHPSTIQPSPQDFIDVYQKLCREADGIVSIHISDKLSGTCNSALQAKETLRENKCPIEVIDSQAVTIGLGLISIAAAAAAEAGKNLPQVLAEVKAAIPNIRMLGLFDTLKYLLIGGRIGKARALVGSMLNVKPMITLKSGEVMPASQVRTRTKGIERLIDFVRSAQNIQDLAVAYNTTPDEAHSLIERLDSIFNKERIRLARVGTTLGVHCGPGFLVVALREKTTSA